MNDHDLSAALPALRPPSPSDAAQARALFRSTLALSGASHATTARPTNLLSRVNLRPRPRLPLAILAPALALLLLGPVFRPFPPALVVASSPPAAEILTQLEHLFPGQLNALIESGGTLELDIVDSTGSGANATAPADQAVVLELERGAQRLRVLAYSGRIIRLRLDNNEVRFAPLLTGSGQVLLAGDDFAWNSAEPTSLRGWQITAHPLAAVL